MKGAIFASLLLISQATIVGSVALVTPASILFVRNGADVCTGVKLSGNFVLTASHCAPAVTHGVSVSQTLDSTGSGVVIANSPALLMAVICSPVYGKALGLATTSPGGVGTTVSIAAGGISQSSTISVNGGGNRITVNPVSGKAPCSGDSGGPGINSSDQVFGVLDKVNGSCGSAGGLYAAVYTSSEKKFIKDALAQAQVCNDWVKAQQALEKAQHALQKALKPSS